MLIKHLKVSDSKEHILNMLNQVFIINKNILLFNDYTQAKY